MVAAVVSYPWELAHAPLYVGMESVRTIWWHCFRASLGDGVLVLGIFIACWAALHRHEWFVHPGLLGYSVMMAVGLAVGITIEWLAVHLVGRWMYTVRMPRVPGLDVGMVPVMQMLVLPPLIFRIVAVWRGRTAAPG